MAFRFPLGSVLRFRESVEKREELALQKALLEIARVRAQIERLSAEIATAQNASNSALRQTMTAFQLQTMLMGIDAAIARRKTLVDSLPALERQCEACLKAYQNAHRDRRMLTEMETRQRDEYDQQRARMEQKFIDDVFAARAQRS